MEPQAKWAVEGKVVARPGHVRLTRAEGRIPVGALESQHLWWGLRQGMGVRFLLG